MSNWKEYIFTVSLCVLSNGIVSQMISDIKGKALIKLSCGIMLTIVLLRPLTKIQIQDFSYMIEENQIAADEYIADGEKKANERMHQYIKTSCEAYILDKAKTLGGELTAQVHLNEKLIPVSAEMCETGEGSIQTELQPIIAADLGIPKEYQTWIWNQEDNSS